MWWKLGGVGLLVAVALIAVLFTPWIGLKITVNFPPVSSTPPLCGPIKFSIERLDGHTKLELDGVATEQGTYLADISKMRAGCAAASIPVYIVADSTLKYGEYTTLTNGLKSARYTKQYLTQITRRE